ncbi:hypothetical protein A3F37_02960 [Candidatus Saccharibacteria bacterium RIFCSPHIGHO2_12_FULL_41_12]|nr:MAG: hypothetical protein A3F37_02960 [Candidatus Saccharibacteria bacterium RIFCSPHIGHO2_12_FULL_41_12]
MTEDNRLNNFPKTFFWGASTASHQVEGGQYNQWTIWEAEYAKELARTAHQRLSWLPAWDRIKDEAEDPDNYISGTGVDHYNRYKEDFALVKKLNLNAFRFTVEWSRIEPEEGKWNEEAIAHYKNYIKELRRQKIEPFLNIWHWTLPVWLAEKKGFEKRSNLQYFERFIQKITDELLDDVQYVIILNEPNNYVSFGYILGEWPPGKKGKMLSAGITYYNLVLAHRRAYKIIKKQRKDISIGAAPNTSNIQPKRPHNVFDILTTEVMRYVWNWWFLNRVRRTMDFVGLNYYFADYYTGLGKIKNPHQPVSDLGWYMEPEGLYPIITRAWAHYKKPIFITETGLADARDEYRRWWIEENIVAMERAISEGVDLRGYLHWSLLDNFEWGFGWWPKFGLVAVDRKHGMKRTIRPSAKWFADWLGK